MMGRQDGQMKMVIMDLSELIPENHLLKQINQNISFDFIYDIMKPLYAKNGRKSIDPVCLIRMLLVGYIYGIKSERRLVEETQLNVAYRWFCNFDLSDKIPDHSTFSQNRRRRWKESTVFHDIFFGIIKACIDKGLVDGESVVVDGSYLPASVSRSSWVDIEKQLTKA